MLKRIRRLTPNATFPAQLKASSRCPGSRGLRRWGGPVALTLAISLPDAADATQRSLSIFGGLLTDNPAEEVLLPWKVDIQRPGLVGIAAAHPVAAPVRFGSGTLDFAIEAQIVRHFGLQSHWEANLPLGIGWTPDQRLLGAIDRASFGIGPSYATRRPAFETQRGGRQAERVMVYWYAEVERRFARRPGDGLFARVHHRSDAFGTVGDGGSSNGLVLGLRRRF
jgi:hypothetical protein